MCGHTSSPPLVVPSPIAATASSRLEQAEAADGEEEPIPFFCIQIENKFQLLARISKANSMVIQTIVFELWPFEYHGYIGIEPNSIPALPISTSKRTLGIFNPQHPISDSKCCNKLRLFSWLLLVDRVNTRNILKRKKHKLEGNNYNCVLCSNNIEETAFHLFFNCPFSQACWRLLEIHWDFAGDFFPK